MGLCATLTGFFLKRECGDVCGQKCSRCYKFVCSKHQSQITRGIVCLECDARERQKDYDPIDPSYTYSNDDYFLYRNFFYASQAYSPPSPDGSDYYSSFNIFNASEFDARGIRREDAEDEEIDLYAS